MIIVAQALARHNMTCTTFLTTFDDLTNLLAYRTYEQNGMKFLHYDDSGAILYGHMKMPSASTTPRTDTVDILCI